MRSTYALTLHRYDHCHEDGSIIRTDIWDSAGQERFSDCHASYFYKADVAILVFDVTRKSTYQHLKKWYEDLRAYCATIPVLVAANKVDTDPAVMEKSFAFATSNGLPLYHVSAADGTNVVRLFSDAIAAGVAWRSAHEGDDVADVLQLLSGSRTS